MYAPARRAIDVRGAHHLHVRLDAARDAVVDDLMRLGDAADERAGDALPAIRHPHPVEPLQHLQRADVHERAVELQRVHEGAHVEGLGDRGDEQVKGARERLHRRGVVRQHGAPGPQPLRVGELARRGGEDGHGGAARRGELHREVAESPETDDAHAPPGRELPVLHWRERGDARAQQRRRGGEVSDRRDAQARSARGRPSCRSSRRVCPPP